jgi:hypothetical protein
MIHMPHFKYFTALALTSLLASAANGEILIADSFESGDMSATNADGFEWGGNNFTSVVTMTANDEPNVVYSSGVKNTVLDAGARDWYAHKGDYSLRFRYSAGSDIAEQRYKMGGAYPEIWMSFWLRVPENFSHPKYSGVSANQKLFYLWMDGYSQHGDGTSVGMEFRPLADGSGGSYFYGKVNGSGDIDPHPFISVPRDLGRWMHLVVHVTSESTTGATDGSLEVWQKWKGDSDYTKTHDRAGLDIHLSSTVKGFAEGYLMGWANSVYPVDTEFLIDDFTLATSPLFSSSGVPPSSPADFVVR